MRPGLPGEDQSSGAVGPPPQRVGPDARFAGEVVPSGPDVEHVEFLQPEAGPVCVLHGVDPDRDAFRVDGSAVSAPVRVRRVDEGPDDPEADRETVQTLVEEKPRVKEI